MVLQSLGEVAIGRLLDQLRQRFGDLILGVIDVLEAMQKQIFHGLDVSCEEAHRQVLPKMAWRECCPNALRNTRFQWGTDMRTKRCSREPRTFRLLTLK